MTGPPNKNLSDQKITIKRRKTREAKRSRKYKNLTFLCLKKPPLTQNLRSKYTICIKQVNKNKQTISTYKKKIAKKRIDE